MNIDLLTDLYPAVDYFEVMATSAPSKSICYPCLAFLLSSTLTDYLTDVPGLFLTGLNIAAHRAITKLTPAFQSDIL